MLEFFLQFFFEFLNCLQSGIFGNNVPTLEVKIA